MERGEPTESLPRQPIKGEKAQGEKQAVHIDKPSPGKEGASIAGQDGE